MALFSKPPAKKTGRAGTPPAPGSGAPRSGAMTAREIAATARGRLDRPTIEPVHGDVTVTDNSSILEWTPSQPAIEVAQANPGLCAVLENAALLYASGQAKPARALLEQGVVNDHDTKLSPLAWLALFDLLQRAGDRAAFDQLALQYVVQFERSPPPWDEHAKPVAGAAKANVGGYLAITGRLTAASAPQVDNIRKAIERKLLHARLDLASVTSFDDDGARLLADALAAARRKGLAIALQRPEKLRSSLAEAVARGRESGEGAWLLALELMQWAREQDAFDEMAIQYAVTFEMSPPSWEPPPAAASAGGAAAPGEASSSSMAADALVWNGVIAGQAGTHLAQLVTYAQGKAIVPIDLTEVERIDFVCAGALLNTIDRIEGQRKAVQIVGASPIVRALLLLIGVSPRHFVRKAT